MRAFPLVAFLVEDLESLISLARNPKPDAPREQQKQTYAQPVERVFLFDRIS